MKRYAVIATIIVAGALAMIALAIINPGAQVALQQSPEATLQDQVAMVEVISITLFVAFWVGGLTARILKSEEFAGPWATAIADLALFPTLFLYPLSACQAIQAKDWWHVVIDVVFFTFVFYRLRIAHVIGGMIRKARF